MKVLTTLQMKMAEAAANANGTSYLRLMENAGAACSKAIRDEYGITPDSRRIITVVCGSGNNGGDGFVIARKLFEIGCRVNVILAGGLPKTEQSGEMFSRIDQTTINVIPFLENEHEALDILLKSDFIIEAVFGIGLERDVMGEYAELFRYINSSPAKTICIDVPGGINSDTGEVMGHAVNADFTVAVCSAKPCHVLLPGKKFCGKIKVVSIGITEKEQFVSGEPYFSSIDLNLLKNVFVKRNDISNKGDYGHVLSIAGSKGMAGAAVLCAIGAVRGGAGLVTAAFPECAYPAIASKLTSPLLLSVENNEDGYFSFSAVDRIYNAMKKSTSIVIGCGLGVNRDTASLVSAVLRNSQVPLVIDADGINIISHNINVLKAAKVPIILTPHPGEMSRLTGKSVRQIQADRIQTAVDFANEYNVIVVLKGANTVVAIPGEKMAFVNTTGNAGMSKGGSGDLLAGMIGAFLAQGYSPENAAIMAVYLHGLAGDIAAEKFSMTSMSPMDTANCLPFALSTLEKAVEVL